MSNQYSSNQWSPRFVWPTNNNSSLIVMRKWFVVTELSTRNDCREGKNRPTNPTFHHDDCNFHLNTNRKNLSNQQPTWRVITHAVTHALNHEKKHFFLFDMTWNIVLTKMYFLRNFLFIMHDKNRFVMNSSTFSFNNVFTISSIYAKSYRTILSINIRLLHIIYREFLWIWKMYLR